MTRQEFEQQYADNGGTTIDALHRLGLYAVPCNCEEGKGGAECLGWQMRNLLNLLTPLPDRSVEHIPDDWCWIDLEADLIAGGETELLRLLRIVMGRERGQEVHCADLLKGE